MDALSTEWRSGVDYATGNRVAFKITGLLGVAAFECLQSRMSSFHPPLLNFFIDSAPFRRHQHIRQSGEQLCGKSSRLSSLKKSLC
jgi:hypothetical protein